LWSYTSTPLYLLMMWCLISTGRTLLVPFVGCCVNKSMEV
jgi:hypothetical protein